LITPFSGGVGFGNAPANDTVFDAVDIGDNYAYFFYSQLIGGYCQVLSYKPPQADIRPGLTNYSWLYRSGIHRPAA
jgi:hypothetical protein